MSQSAIALFVFAPAPVDLPPIERQSLLVPPSFGVLFWQRIPFLFRAGDLFLQLVNLSPGAGLPAIKTAGLQEEWPTHLLTVFIHSGCSQERVHPQSTPRTRSTFSQAGSTSFSTSMM